MKANQVESKKPPASEFVKSPLRNQIRLELNAPVDEVWKLVGDPARMPEYSFGLEKVDTRFSNSGRCEEYVCYFKPQEAGGQEIVHKAIVKWHETNVGWASLDEEPNVFSLSESLTLITLSRQKEKTVLNWDMHYNALTTEMLEMNKSSLNQALNDIALRLTSRFGGRILKQFIEGEI